MAMEITDQNFEMEVIKSDVPVVVVDFWAPWCGPCQMMGPIIEELAEELKGKVKVGKLNVDENPGKAGEYAVMSIPTMKVFKDGKPVKDFIGVQRKDALKEALLSV